MKKQISVQLQLERLPIAERPTSAATLLRPRGGQAGTPRPTPDSRAREFLRSLAERPGAELVSLEGGNDDGDYVTAVISSDDLQELWSSIKEQLKRRAFQKAAIVVCQGDDG